MQNKEQLMEMKSEHDLWQNKIQFYRGEIKQLNSHLGDIANLGSSMDIMPLVEHFQNQFIRQKEVLDIIRHEFKEHENLIEKVENEQAVKENIQKLHFNQREKLAQFERIFKELQVEYTLFLNKLT